MVLTAVATGHGLAGVYHLAHAPAAPPRGAEGAELAIAKFILFKHSLTVKSFMLG